MVRLLAFFAPWTKYLTLGAIVCAFLAGWWVTKEVYQSRIEQTKIEYSKQVIKYQDRVMELDADFSKKLKEASKTRVITLKEVQREVQKPEYNCPVPDQSVRLLNDAIRATRGPSGDSK